MFRRHPVLTFFTLAYLAVVAWVTLGPQPLDDSADSLLWRFLDLFERHEVTSWITYDRVEFTANILMFLPIGLFFLLLLGRRRWWLAILFGFFLTVVIETAQLFIPGRVSDIRDIESNTIGAVIGVLVGLLLTWGKARRLKFERLARENRARENTDTQQPRPVQATTRPTTQHMQRASGPGERAISPAELAVRALNSGDAPTHPYPTVQYH
jgi:glycopeptide antibiotics resistance protein